MRGGNRRCFLASRTSDRTATRGWRTEEPCRRIVRARLLPRRIEETWTVANKCHQLDSRGEHEQISNHVLTRLFAISTNTIDRARQRRKERIASAGYQCTNDGTTKWPHLSFCVVEDHFHPFKMHGIEHSSTKPEYSSCRGREGASSKTIHKCIACSIRPSSSPVPRDCGPRHKDENTRYQALSKTLA